MPQRKKNNKSVLRDKPKKDPKKKNPGTTGLKKQAVRNHQSITQQHSTFRAFLDSISDAVLIMDASGMIMDVSNSATLLFGIPRKEFIDRKLIALAPLTIPENKECLKKLAARIDSAMNGRAVSIECRGKRKKGQEFIAEIKLKRARYPGGAVIMATARDVTEKYTIELELRESELRYKTLQQASFGGLGLHDQGVIIECNQGLTDITGFSRRELIGSDGIRLIAPEWRSYVIEKIMSGTERPYDVEGMRKDGKRYFLEVRARNVPYRGKMVRVTEFRNINERKLSEGRIKEQNSKLTNLADDLRRKNEQLEEFTQIVSHNLRSPVGNILTLIGFLESATSDQERSELLVMLKDSGLTAQQTLQELHEVLKIKQNKQIPRQQLHFDKALRHVERMLNGMITENGATVIREFGDAPTIEYPNIYLESILLNLLSNSLKYRRPMVKPVIRFRTFYTRNSIVLEVIDNGSGINMKRYGHQVFKLHKIFHRHPESRGIGLFMIKNQIEALGGEISMRSRENKGTTVTVIFNKLQFDEPEVANSSGS